MRVTSSSVKALLMLKGISRIWNNTVYADIQAGESMHHFSKTMSSHILQQLQQCGFIPKECNYETSMPAVQTCLPLRMCGMVWCTKYDNKDPGLLSNSSGTSSKNGGKKSTLRASAVLVLSSLKTYWKECNPMVNMHLSQVSNSK